MNYLALTEGTQSIGRTLPTAMSRFCQCRHHPINAFCCILFAQLHAFVLPRKLGEVLCAALRVKIRDGKFREPDLVFMTEEHRDRIGEEYWEGADLVMEVVSRDAESRKRDLLQKPLEYAEAGIQEYWIVDPMEERITVLTLQGQSYQQHGAFIRDNLATSKLLDGFSVNVNDVLDAAKT